MTSRPPNRGPPNRRDNYNSNSSTNQYSGNTNRQYRDNRGPGYQDAHYDSNGRWSKDSSVIAQGRQRDRNYSHNTDQYQSNSNSGPPKSDHPQPVSDESTTKLGSYAEKLLKERQEQERLKKEREDEAKMTEEELLVKYVGFATFGSSKNKHVPRSNPFFARPDQKRRYSQYLNRKTDRNLQKRSI